ncbi:hypothetical protein ES703_17407 [subsurface metagenome]
MAKIQWKKDDVIKKFQEAIAGSQLGGRPAFFQDLLNRAKAKVTGKPIEGEGEV